jgi:hypothetical protein
MEEAARRRELDRLLSFSVSRDGIPLAWRRALRMMLWVLLVEGCRSGDKGAFALVVGALNRSRRATVGETGRMEPLDVKAET